MWPTCWKLSWLSVKCSSSCFSLELFKDVWLPSNSEQARVGLKAEIVLSVNSGLLDFRKSWSGECDSTCRDLDKEEEEQVEMWLLQWFQLLGACNDLSPPLLSQLNDPTESTQPSLLSPAHSVRFTPHQVYFFTTPVFIICYKLTCTTCAFISSSELWWYFEVVLSVYLSAWVLTGWCVSEQMVGIYLARNLIADIEKVKFSYWSLQGEGGELTPGVTGPTFFRCAFFFLFLLWCHCHRNWNKAFCCKLGTYNSTEATFCLCILFCFFACSGSCDEVPP